MPPKPKIYKVTLVGDIGVGKSTIINNLVNNKNNSVPNSTIGVSCSHIKCKYQNNNFILSVWDTAGQERYHSMVPLCVRDSSLVIMVYDSRNTESLKNIYSYWYPFVKEHSPENVIYYLVEHKVDTLNSIDEYQPSEYNGVSIKNFKTTIYDDRSITDLFDHIQKDVITINGCLDPPSTYFNFNSGEKCC